jgi:TolB-like protein/predicted Ser/Thr protein kinase
MIGPYEIVSSIGSGGMGQVYRAKDTRLGRTVAIKILNKEHMQRFEREARAIAALNHPNICTLHDIGSDYLVMEYVDGTAIKGPLPVEEAVRLAIQIAGALDEAHKRGILHRDLKPGNIMVTSGGSTKLLDFGLAKLSARSESETASTMDGTVMGTPAYMSPEQAQGMPVDARSDIFSFGAVLYEIISGTRAFDGASAVQVLSAVLRDEPKPLQTPPQLERIMMRCLAKQPAQRFQTMAEVKTALEQVSVKPAEQQASIAVLPFADMSPNKDNEWFSDGLAEEITNVLAQIPELKVTARTSAFAFRGKEQDIRKIAEMLGVRTILEGSVRRVGNRIRVTAQLINAADGYHLWSQRYDRDIEDVFAIQDEVAGAISKALQIKLSVDARGPRQYEPNLPAYEAYLKARHYFAKTDPDSCARSMQYAEQSIALDSGFAQPHIQISDCLLALTAGLSLIPAHEAMPKIREEALKALAIDASLSEAHALIGIVAGVYDYNWQEVERRFELALSCHPVSFQVQSWYAAFHLLLIGRVREAIEENERALSQDPLSIPSRSTLVISLLALGRHADANREIRKMMEIDGNLPLQHHYLGLSYVAQEMYEEALACAERSYLLAPWYKPSIAMLAGLLARKGLTIRVQELLMKLGSRQEYGVPFSLAEFHLLCGEIDKAADWLEKAIAQRHPLILFWMALPHWKVLKSSPRWPALMKLLNLPEIAAL